MVRGHHGRDLLGLANADFIIKYQILLFIISLLYINNNELGLWVDSEGNTNILVNTCYQSSVLAVLINLYKVVATLFDDDITAYYGLLVYLKERSFHDMEE